MFIKSTAFSIRVSATLCPLPLRKCRPEACTSRSHRRAPNIASLQCFHCGTWRCGQKARLACLGNDAVGHQNGHQSSTTPSEKVDTVGEESSASQNSSVKIDLNVNRRRTLLVKFTCDKCETRSERLVNPEAYARGTVFVQCQGCGAWHQLVDHMGLIKEYDLRQEPTSEAEEQQG
eukprot:jgi/Ulvmu1/3905/UM018_0127.1